MPAAVSASVAAAVATNAQEAWRDHRPVRTLEDKNMTPSDGSTIVNSSRSSLDGANIFRVNGIATLTAHKPQLVTIAPVGDMYTILPSCA
ncbi:hypothetical protein LPJ63_001857 [Coemansia sp. RSA 2711]|nr:hypothetical protein LPJ63_001857 [Coemansia sp. RSA 2711]KAJ1845123.1 hypothetical protein LPJ70_002644 [Coemansia sp. RSA 2708]